MEAIINRFTDDDSFSEIILLGHSQGGVVAGKVAAESNAVEKLILMASTGVPLKKLLRFQVKQRAMQANVDSTLMKNELNAREQLIEAITSGKGITKATKNYREKFKALQISVGVDSGQASNMAKQQANRLVEIFQSPQTQSLLHYNPTDDLQKLDIPVLVLLGGKDTQVTVEMNKLPIESALDSAATSYQTKVFADANPLFQKANTGSMQEYAVLKSEFVDGFISTLTKWIKEADPD